MSLQTDIGRGALYIRDSNRLFADGPPRSQRPPPLDSSRQIYIMQSCSIYSTHTKLALRLNVFPMTRWTKERRDTEATDRHYNGPQQPLKTRLSLFEKNGKRPAATIFYNGVYIYMTPFFFFFFFLSLAYSLTGFNDIPGACRHSVYLCCCQLPTSPISFTHTQGGGGGIPSSSSTRSLEGRRKDGPYMYTLSAVYT